MPTLRIGKSQETLIDEQRGGTASCKTTGLIFNSRQANVTRQLTSCRGILKQIEASQTTVKYVTLLRALKARCWQRGFRLLDKSTRSYGKPERRGVVSSKVDVQAWPLSNMTVQEDLL